MFNSRHHAVYREWSIPADAYRSCDVIVDDVTSRSIHINIHVWMWTLQQQQQKKRNKKNLQFAYTAMQLRVGNRSAHIPRLIKLSTFKHQQVINKFRRKTASHVVPLLRIELSLLLLPLMEMEWFFLRVYEFANTLVHRRCCVGITHCSGT